MDLPLYQNFHYHTDLKNVSIIQTETEKFKNGDDVYQFFVRILRAAKGGERKCQYPQFASNLKRSSRIEKKLHSFYLIINLQVPDNQVSTDLYQ